MIRRSCLLIVLLIGAWAARASLAAPNAVTTAESLSLFPVSIDGWTGEDFPLEPDVIKTAAVDDYLNRSYLSTAGSLGLYVGYYQNQRQGEALHSPLQCLPGAGWQPVDSESIDLRKGSDGRARRIEKLVVEQGANQLLVLYWYQTLKRVTGSEYLRKLFLVSDAFASGRTDVALVRIIAPIDFRDPDSRTKALSVAQPFAERMLPEIQQRLFRE